MQCTILQYNATVQWGDHSPHQCNNGGGEDSPHRGKYSNSTEWKALQPDPFAVRHGFSHCNIQLSDGSLVVTVGFNTEPCVTQYHLDGRIDCSLTPLLRQPRRSHVCGFYTDADDQQVRSCFGILPPSLGNKAEILLWPEVSMLMFGNNLYFLKQFMCHCSSVCFKTFVCTDIHIRSHASLRPDPSGAPQF